MSAVSQPWDAGNAGRDPAELRHALGVPIMPMSLERALTHRSYAYENDNPPTNERLEFLGDSVLGLVVTDTLFRSYPSMPEGQLAKLRAAVVQMRALAEASALVHRLFDPVIDRSARLGAGLDWKTSLQELTAARMLGVPDYQVEESGPDHQKSFRAVVRVGGRVLGSGEGRSKKEAEQHAAEAAWTTLNAESSGPGK